MEKNLGSGWCMMVKVYFKSLVFVFIVSFWYNTYAADTHFVNAYNELRLSNVNETVLDQEISNLQSIVSNLEINPNRAQYQESAKKYVSLEYKKVLFNYTISVMNCFSFLSLLYANIYGVSPFQQHTALMPINGALLGFWIQNIIPQNRFIIFAIFSASWTVSLAFKPQEVWSWINSLTAGLTIPMIKSFLEPSSLPSLRLSLSLSAMNSKYKREKLCQIILLLSENKNWSVHNVKSELDNFFTSNNLSNS
jgi:hypothetical protein